MSSSRRSLYWAVAICLTLALTPFAHGQLTTGSIAGTVIAADGSTLPGVTVEATHTPTGTRYDAVTTATGRFVIPNVRVGGPYTVTATLEGFRPTAITGVQVGLGSTVEVPVTLQLAAIAETVTVTAEVDPIINPNRTGATSSVSTEAIETLPTVNRSLQDFARTNPYFVVDAQDFSATRVTVAGRNNRYNSIQIDGAVNNDLFGLADTGTPGGQTDAQPISLDAIEQLQLVVSPYDVRQGGFTGGGINAVTRSGTNEFSGSLFGSRRDPEMVGDGPLDRPVSDFDQEQYGGRLGGPIARDRLFFFLSGEVNRKTAPTGFSADGSSGVKVADSVAAGAVRLRDFLISRYQYDPGSLGDFGAATDSDLLLLKFDWNVNSNNQLTLRHNYVDAVRDVWGGRSSSRWTFETATYGQADETNTTVAQLNSIFSPTTFNEARINIQTIHDERSVPVTFPSIEIGGSARNGTWAAGTERFSAANALDQDIMEITDDFTMMMGNHTVVIGTHNEFFEFKNLFLSEAFGYYFFPTLDAWEAGNATEYRISYATGDDPRRPTQFEAGQYGLYVNDSWRVSNALNLTLGIRADLPTFPDSPSFNQRVMDLINFNTSETPAEDVVVSPRIGFNWQPGGTGSQQVRGGVGIFAGRTPYVWISNAYANTGIETIALSCIVSTNPATSCTPRPFNPDVNQQPRDLGAGGALSVDLIDPDFQFPRVLRATLGYDRELFFGIRGSAEVLWSQTQEDVFYYNVNRRPTGNVSPLDGRPTFTRLNTGLADAIQLSNTGEGQELTATLQLNRPFANGLTLSANYAWQDAESAFDATSSRAISNWQFRHTQGDIFAQDVSRSAFEIEHRYNISAAYNFNTGPVFHRVGLFWNAQTGRPYSIMMGGDPNTDGYGTNDILFVPNGSSAYILCPSGASAAPNASSPCRSNTATFTPLDSNRLFNYLAAAGLSTDSRILDRYEANEPWSRQMDFHYEFGMVIAGVEPRLVFDVQNLLNMIDEDYGVVEFVSNQNVTPVNYRGIDPTSGKPVYAEAFSNSLNERRQFSIADTRSRWQAKVGVRISF